MDIFTRLATQQLATTPLLRPALRPYFASRQGYAQAADSEPGPHEGTSGLALQDSQSRQTTEGAVQNTRTTAAAHLTSSTMDALMSDEGSARSDRRSTSPRLAPDSMPEQLPLAPARQPLDHTRHTGSRDRIALPGAQAPERVPHTPPIAEGRASATASPLLAAVASRARGAPQAGVESPLSAHRVQVLTHAPRPQAEAQAPPVVHLHIDRIEVRAPAAAARPMSPRVPQHREPETSLADYLRRGSRR